MISLKISSKRAFSAKQKIAAAIGAGALLVGSFLPVLAATEGAVTATVTPQIVAISVAPPTVDYGTLDFSATDISRTVGLSGTITVTNDGNVNEDFAIKGDNSTNWTLDSSPANTGTVAIDQFVHRFDADATFTDGTANALSTSNQSLGVGVASSATQDFELQMNMPLSGSVTGVQTTTVTVQASAS